MPPSSLVQAYLFPAKHLSIDLYVCEQPLRWGHHQNMQKPSILYNLLNHMLQNESVVTYVDVLPW